jgi:hypothetical protein
MDSMSCSSAKSLDGLFEGWGVKVSQEGAGDTDVWASSSRPLGLDSPVAINSSLILL